VNDQLGVAFILNFEGMTRFFALFDPADVVVARIHREFWSGWFGLSVIRAVLRRGLREGGEGNRDDQR
jgi:hypothetical protein